MFNTYVIFLFIKFYIDFIKNISRRKKKKKIKGEEINYREKKNTNKKTLIGKENEMNIKRNTLGLFSRRYRFCFMFSDLLNLVNMRLTYICVFENCFQIFCGNSEKTTISS